MTSSDTDTTSSPRSLSGQRIAFLVANEGVE
jgi:hypothetical protein